MFFLYSAESNGFSQRSKDRVLDDNNSNEYGCSCTCSKQQFDECVEDTGRSSPNDDHNLLSPLDGQHGRHLCSSRREPQHSPSNQTVYSFSSREESGAPNDRFLSNAFRCCFRLSGVLLKFCRLILACTKKLLSVRIF